MDLSIYICPIYQALYNESMMVVNNQEDKPECYGMANWTAEPPVLNFRFTLNESSISACNNNFQVFSFMHVTVIKAKLYNKITLNTVLAVFHQFLVYKDNILKNTFSAVSRPSLRLEVGSLLTSQTSSTSTSRASSTPWIIPPAPSPIALRSSTSSRASTRCSTS